VPSVPIYVPSDIWYVNIWRYKSSNKVHLLKHFF
jgi:hypothetical protein